MLCLLLWWQCRPDQAKIGSAWKSMYESVDFKALLTVYPPPPRKKRHTNNLQVYMLMLSLVGRISVRQSLDFVKCCHICHIIEYP